MESFLETIEIGVPANIAWTIVVDYSNDSRWRTGVLEMSSDPPGPATAGTLTHEVIRIAGRVYRNDGLVDLVVPGQRLEWHTTSGADAHGARAVRAIGPNRSSVSLELHVIPHGINRVLAPLLRSTLAKGLRKDLAELERLVAPTPNV